MNADSAVMVSVHTTTTTTITKYLLTASAAGMALVTTGVLPSASMPWSTIAMPTAYARSAYSPYAGYAPPSGPASARPVREAVGQQRSLTRIDLVGVYLEAYINRSGWHANVGDYVYGAKRNSYAGAGTHFEPIIRNVFSVGFNGVGAVTRAPVSTIGQPVSDGYYGYCTYGNLSTSTSMGNGRADHYYVNTSVSLMQHTRVRASTDRSNNMHCDLTHHYI